MTASAYHVISTEVENHIFKRKWIFRHLCIQSNPHWQCSGIIIHWYYKYSVSGILDTLVGSSWMCALCARCNIIRTSWETKKERLSYRKKHIEEFVQGISLFWLHPLLSMSFSCFFCLLPPPSQVTYLQSGPYKDI